MKISNPLFILTLVLAPSTTFADTASTAVAPITTEERATLCKRFGDLAQKVLKIDYVTGMDIRELGAKGLDHHPDLHGDSLKIYNAVLDDVWIHSNTYSEAEAYLRGYTICMAISLASESK